MLDNKNFKAMIESLQREEERFKLKFTAISETADWWFKEMNAAVANMELINNNKKEASIEEREELESRIRYLARKADWEVKEQNKLQKIRQDLLCRKVALSLMNPNATN